MKRFITLLLLLTVGFTAMGQHQDNTARGYILNYQYQNNYTFWNPNFYWDGSYIVLGASNGIKIGNFTLTSAGFPTYTAGTGLTLSNNIFSITNTITAGECTYCSLTVNAQGQLTAASSGTAPVNYLNDTVAGSGATPQIATKTLLSDSTQKRVLKTDSNVGGGYASFHLLTPNFFPVGIPQTISSFTYTSPAKMGGLRDSLIIKTSGNILCIITGDVDNTTSATDGVTFQASWGTGITPVKGASATGTAFGTQHSILQFVASSKNIPFTCSGMIATGQSAGTSVWFDLQGYVSTGTSVFSSVSVTLVEIP